MIMGLLVGPIRATFQISDTQYSLLAGLAFSIFYCLMGFPLARIADRGSRRLLIGVGIAVWSLMTAACGLAKSFWGLFFARVGVGVDEATLGPAAYSIITDYFTREMLARALSIYMIGVTLGSGVAYMVGGSVVQWVQSLGTVELPWFGEMYGWQPVFFLVGLPGLVIALLMATVREPTRRGGLASAGATQLPVRDVVAYVVQRRRAYGAHIIGISVYVMVVYGLNLWGPTYLIRTFGYSTAQAGWTFGAIMVGAGTLGLLAAGWIADAWSARGRADAYPRIILGSIVAMVPFVVALGFIDDVALALPVLSIAIFISAIQGGLTGGTLQLMTPNQMRAQVMALYGFLANLIGIGLGPTVVAAITDYVFGRDDAIAQSLALTGAVLCPIAALILWWGLGAIRTELEAARG
ncbi:MAG TPA: MFS transporter, partial [Pseudomonadales bacterium]